MPSIQLYVIVTTYRPPAGLPEKLSPLLGHGVKGVVIVDNTPGGHEFGSLPAGILLVQDGVNKGLGGALNCGITEARRLGGDAVLLLDQDSHMTPPLILALHAVLDHAHQTLDQKVCVAPWHVDDGKAPLPNPAPAFTGLKKTSCLPTSGMMFSLQSLHPEDTFSTALFLDLVDFDWCWRLGKKGWRFLRAPGLQMRHRRGTEERRLLGIQYFTQPPYRHYFQFRDTLRLVFRSHMPLYSKLRLGGVLPIKALFYPLLVENGLERIYWMARGIYDATRGRSGIGAAKKVLGGV
jgi:rhamnosyltransferase